MEDRHREFLLSLDAHKTQHSGRTLFDHLKGVHDLLRDWDNDEDVCLAGLYHSIYGTDVFKHQSMSDRVKLKEMIGEVAERLVFLFGVSKDRPLFESVLHPETRTQLQEIETANLIEQGGSENALRKFAKIKLSNGAKAALSGVA